MSKNSFMVNVEKSGQVKAKSSYQKRKTITKGQALGLEKVYLGVWLRSQDNFRLVQFKWKI